MKNCNVISVLLLFLAGSLSAQQITPFVIASAGDFYSSQNFSVSWTLGELATETIGTDVILTQGFQQPSYSTGTYVPPVSSDQFRLRVYPVPAYNSLTVQVKGNETTDLYLDMYDALGRKLISAKMEAGTPEYEMDLSGIHPGMYFLKVTTAAGESIKTYQIPKALK
ncbi:MAG: T9SS type A sorting domain-containing protein [Bacteroidales bacterium]